jgi:acetyl esterase/lipase
MRSLRILALGATLLGLSLLAAAADSDVPATYALTLVLSTTGNQARLHVEDGVLLVDSWRIEEETGQMWFRAWEAIEYTKPSTSLSRMTVSIDVRVVSFDPDVVRWRLDLGTYGRSSLEIHARSSTDGKPLRTISHRADDDRPAVKTFETQLSELSGTAAPEAMSIDVTSDTYRGYETHTSIPYASIAGVEPPDLTSLDLYLPPRDTDHPPPLIVWIHGGGWWKGGKGEQSAVEIFASRYAVASINYRLAPNATFPTQIHDCKAAVRWLRAHAVEYGYDPTRFGVFGESAGAHLALLLGLGGDVEAMEGTVGDYLNQSSSVQAVCDFAGPTDLFTYRDSVPEDVVPGLDAVVSDLLGGSPAVLPELATLGSPMYHISADDPPCLIVHGDTDEMVGLSQSTDLYDALVEAGVDAELLVLEGCDHVMAKWPMDTVVAPTLRAFFEQAFALVGDSP